MPDELATQLTVCEASWRAFLVCRVACGRAGGFRMCVGLAYPARGWWLEAPELTGYPTGCLGSLGQVELLLIWPEPS